MEKLQVKDIDRSMGEVLRETRLKSGLTQADLAEKIGVTFQQVQKYEKGTNRISISRLFMIADAMAISPIELIDQLQDYIAHQTTSDYQVQAARQKFISTKEGREALVSIAEIENTKLFSSFLVMLNALRNTLPEQQKEFLIAEQIEE